MEGLIGAASVMWPEPVTKLECCSQPRTGTWLVLEKGLKSALHFDFKEEQIDSSKDIRMLLPKKG